MSELNKIEEIEKYLSGELSGKELTDFENQLSSDQKLAEEVDFQKNIESILAHRPEDDLRVNLNKLDAKYSTPSNSTQKFIIGGIGLILIVAMLGWWMINTEDNSSISTPIKSTEEIKQTTATEDQLREKFPQNSEQLNEVSKEDIPASSPGKKTPAAKEPTQKTKQTEKAKSRPIAANFAPNELLESRLGSLRSDELTVKAMEYDLTLKNGKIDFVLNGKLVSDKDIEDRELTLYIFSNKMDDYENFKPAFSKILPLEKTEEGFEFKLFEPIQLNKGLFYFQIEDEIGEILYIDKFRIN